MTQLTNSEIQSVSHPKGTPVAANFTLTENEGEPRQDQQVLVRNLFMLADRHQFYRGPSRHREALGTKVRKTS